MLQYTPRPVKPIKPRRPSLTRLKKEFIWTSDEINLCLSDVISRIPKNVSLSDVRFIKSNNCTKLCYEVVVPNKFYDIQFAEYQIKLQAYELEIKKWQLELIEWLEYQTEVRLKLERQWQETANAFADAAIIYSI